MECGIVYIATGEEYIKDAIESAKNTRKHTELPIALISDRNVDDDLFSEVIIDQEPHHSFIDKPRNLMKTPFDKSLFLDTDVYLMKDVPELFDILDTFDIATTIDPNEWELRYDRDRAFEEIPESFPLFQTGVIPYRSNENISKFIDKWLMLHEENDVRSDQSSFRAALYETDIKHTTLSDLYNCLLGWPMQVTGEVKIVHDSDHIDNLSKLDAIVRRVNETDEPRIFFTPRGSLCAPLWPRGDLILKCFSKISKSLFSTKVLISRGIRALRERGLRYTINETIKKISN